MNDRQAALLRDCDEAAMWAEMLTSEPHKRARMTALRDRIEAELAAIDPAQESPRSGATATPEEVVAKVEDLMRLVSEIANAAMDCGASTRAQETRDATDRIVKADALLRARLESLVELAGRADRTVRAAEMPRPAHTIRPGLS